MAIQNYFNKSFIKLNLAYIYREYYYLRGEGG